MAVQRKSDVLIIGAGPVGLFAALNLAERGLDVQVVDKDWRGAAHSYALALHPDTLRLLDSLGVADDLLGQGYRVERMALYQGQERVGQFDFAALDKRFPFLLIAAQSALEQALSARLVEKKVKVLWNHQAMSIEQDGDGVTAKIGRMEKYSTGYPVAHTEWMVAKEYTTRASFLIGADGYASFVRRGLDIEFEDHGAAQAFSVYEFPLINELPHEARVVFHPDSANVVWPLDDDRNRWSFQVDAKNPAQPTLEDLDRLIGERAPWYGSRPSRIGWHTTVLFERRLASSFGRGRIWLAGDAAHITGPVGGHSMNVGLREVRDLAECFSSILSGDGSLAALAGYDEERRKEWSVLLGLGSGLASSKETPAWATDLAARILPCVPASGDDLTKLLGQIGLRPA
jgi:2-polyprenyl-6-methoxyphenol hydroxylase-like FAD-dependent oxidoreductase